MFITIKPRCFNSVIRSAMDRAILFSGGRVPYDIRIDNIFGDLSVQVSDLTEIFAPNAIHSVAHYCDPCAVKPLGYKIRISGNAEKGKDIKAFIAENGQAIFSVDK